MSRSRIPVAKFPVAKVPGWRCAALSHELAIERQMAKAAPLSREEIVAQRIASRRRQVLNNLSPKVRAAAAKLEKVIVDFSEVPPEPCDCCRHRGAPKKALRWKSKESLVEIQTTKQYPKECWPDRYDRAAFDRAQGWRKNNYATFTEADALAEDD
ncbi:MAG: hypothetical protein LQ352_000567 [Teloschistes flavicans]|nr:MAG: hypothetical protein LQ352_000567 [Teloschistes flavicans]